MTLDSTYNPGNIWTKDTNRGYWVARYKSTPEKLTELSPSINYYFAEESMWYQKQIDQSLYNQLIGNYDHTVNVLLTK